MPPFPTKGWLRIAMPHGILGSLSGLKSLSREWGLFLTLQPKHLHSGLLVVQRQPAELTDSWLGMGGEVARHPFSLLLKQGDTSVPL